MTIRELVNEKGATVIDVRSSWEFADGHVNNALNIPLEEIPTRIDEIKAVKGVIEKDIRDEYAAIMSRLKSAEGVKLAVL
jgi:rhodanese-related sulfurtransferase